MQVEVRPLPTKKWHGKTGKESFSQPVVIEVLYDHNTGSYATGLTEEETQLYQKKLGVDLSSNFNPNEAHAFWGTKAAQIKLENHTMVFDTDKPAEFVKIKNLKASKFVANSIKEWEEGKFPDATHVIFDENEEIQLKAAKVQRTQKANIIAHKMSSDQKAQMVQILSSKTVKNRSADFLDVEIDNIIREKPEEFLKYSSMDKDEVYVRASILECLDKHILTKESGSIYYMGELIAIDYEAAVEWFKNPDNSKIKVSILEKLQK